MPKELEKYITSETSDNLPNVSVIIPVYNAESFIAGCLERIINQSYPKEKLEILVVDNASTDRSASIIKSFPVKYLFCEKRGPSAARNLAIKAASGEYLVFIDADCLAESTLVYNHIQAHLALRQIDPAIKAVGGGISGFNPNFWAICDDFCSWYLYHPSLKPKTVTTYHPTANISIARKTIDEVGMFDEDHFVAEDVLFCKKLTAVGYKLYFEPQAKVQHINRTTCKDFFGHARHWACCNLLLETDNKKTGSINSKIFLLFKYLYRYLKAIIKVVFYALMARRIYVVLFIPFIILNRTYFGYHKLKYGRVI